MLIGIFLCLVFIVGIAACLSAVGAFFFFTPGTIQIQLPKMNCNTQYDREVQSEPFQYETAIKCENSSSISLKQLTITVSNQENTDGIFGIRQYWKTLDGDMVGERILRQNVNGGGSREFVFQEPGTCNLLWCSPEYDVDPRCFWDVVEVPEKSVSMLNPHKVCQNCVLLVGKTNEIVCRPDRT